MELVLSNELHEISMDECYAVVGGMSTVQAVTATIGIGCIAWSVPIAIVNPAIGAGVLLVGAGLTINSFN